MFREHFIASLLAVLCALRESTPPTDETGQSRVSQIQIPNTRSTHGRAAALSTISSDVLTNAIRGFANNFRNSFQFGVHFIRARRDETNGCCPHTRHKHKHV